MSVGRSPRRPAVRRYNFALRPSCCMVQEVRFRQQRKNNKVIWRVEMIRTRGKLLIILAGAGLEKIPRSLATGEIDGNRI